MGTTYNVAEGAIDVEDLAAMQEAGFVEDSQVAPDGNFDAPADFEDTQVPGIIQDMRKTKKTPKPKQTPKQLAAAQRSKERAAEKKKADAEKKRAAAKAEREKKAAEKAAEREAAKEAKRLAKEAGPDLTGLVDPKAGATRTKLVHVPIDALDGIDGGDPVDKSFVDNVKLNGILQPIRVRKEVAADGQERYNIVFGKRRSQAARALLAAGDKRFETIPAMVETGEGANDYIQGLIENYARSNNIMEEYRMITALQDEGYGVKQIAKATGMKLSQVSRAANVGRLLPELQDAVEAGQLESWNAAMASRLSPEIQQELVRRLEKNGKITKNDVGEVSRHKQAAAVKEKADAAAASGQDMFSTPDVDAEAATPVASLSRTEKVARAVTQVQAALGIFNGLTNRSADEDDAIVYLTQIVENLTSNPS